MSTMKFTSWQDLDGNEVANSAYPPGLVLVKSQVVGTAVSSVTVNDCFSASFNNYLIIDSGGSMSVDTLYRLSLGSAVTQYYYNFTRNAYDSSTVYVEPGSNQTSFAYAGGGSTQRCGIILLTNPYSNLRTRMSTQMIQYGTFFANVQGFLNDSNSYSGFTITPLSGTFTGGTIRVYGYTN